MRRLFLATAAIVAAVVVFVLATLPPAPRPTQNALDPGLVSRTWPGAFHVHSSRSDGADSREAVAAAASRAGLRFVVFTEHGDGTRAPERPSYIGGVLCVDGLEISTNGGHYVALDLPTVPYRLGGEAASVVEDVTRFGGFGIAAHPDSLKPALAWSDWSAPIDGLEWLNADSEWRDESRLRLTGTFLSYFFRPASALASLLDRPSTTLARWDQMTAARPLVAVAGHDAHGWIAGRQEGSAPGLRGIPSYEATFRSFALRAIVDSPATGDPSADARRLVGAIRRGNVFTAIDAVASPALLDFRAERGAAVAPMGGSIPPGDGDVTFTARSSMPEGGTIVLLRNGTEIAQSTASPLSAKATDRGAYRIEIHAAGAPGSPPVPWVVGNPIYVLDGQSSPPASQPVVLKTLDALDWRLEKDDASSGTVLRGSGESRFEYRLKSGEETSQYVAMAADLRSLPADADAVLLRLRSSKPDRVLIQLRSASRGGARLVASAYVSPQPRDIVLDVGTFRSAERPEIRFGIPDASSLLIVADLTNHAAGASGEIEISDVRLARGR